jgi:hypothetical protein
MLLNDEATLTASVAGPVERNIFSFLSFPFLYNVVFLFLFGVWCVCVCAVVCVTCPYTQKGARAHTQTDTWWFTGCVPTCLLSVLWCRVLARDGDGTDTAENLTQQAKRPPSSLLLSIIYLLLLLLILLLKIFFFWKLWTAMAASATRRKPKNCQNISTEKRKNKQFSFNNRVGWCQTPTIQQGILSWLFKKKPKMFSKQGENCDAVPVHRFVWCYDSMK